MQAGHKKIAKPPRIIYTVSPAHSNEEIGKMIELTGDLHVRGSSLWLDARRKRPLSFVSHAHSDHLAPHQMMIASPPTAALARHRLGERAIRQLEFNTPIRIDDLTLELLPAGHILGSAQAYIEHQGSSLLYTGDCRLRRSPACRPIETRQADILVMECTYGEPCYVFPPQEEVTEELCEFLDECLASGVTPVLLAYALGKAQEVMKMVGERGYQLAVHERIWQIAEVYRQFGMEFPGAELLDVRELNSKVVVVPPGRAGESALAQVQRKRTAFLSGWAMRKGAGWVRSDRAFPLSDHADFQELLQLAELVGPRKILTLHGPETFVRHLRQAGFDAEPLKPGTQLAHS